MSNHKSATPIFTKTYDFLAWLIPVTNHFPKAHRHAVTRRLLDAALEFQERLFEANNLRGGARLGRLQEADLYLDKLRCYLRLAHHWPWLNPGQYEHAGRQVAELGRMLGGWQRLTRQQLALPNAKSAL